MNDLRLRRLFNPKNGKTIIIPLDHGVTSGPIDGINNICSTVNMLSKSEANAVILHKGCIRVCKDILTENNNLAVIMHASASLSISPQANRKVLVASVEEAVQIGADAISIHINIGNESDLFMIEDFGKISEACTKWGMPLIVMVYPRGKNIEENDHKCNLLGARVAMELGADIVKINCSGTQEEFSQLINSVNIPVIIAGGAKKKNVGDLLFEIEQALKAGAAGISIGRNIFQFESPLLLINIINQLINKEIALDEALFLIKTKNKNKDVLSSATV